jgi:hypothetical protein
VVTASRIAVRMPTEKNRKVGNQLKQPLLDDAHLILTLWQWQ